MEKQDKWKALEWFLEQLIECKVANIENPFESAFSGLYFIRVMLSEDSLRVKKIWQKVKQGKQLESSWVDDIIEETIKSKAP